MGFNVIETNWNIKVCVSTFLVVLIHFNLVVKLRFNLCFHIRLHKIDLSLSSISTLNSRYSYLYQAISMFPARILIKQNPDKLLAIQKEIFGDLLPQVVNPLSSQRLKSTPPPVTNHIHPMNSPKPPKLKDTLVSFRDTYLNWYAPDVDLLKLSNQDVSLKSEGLVNVGMEIAYEREKALERRGKHVRVGVYSGMRPALVKESKKKKRK